MDKALPFVSMLHSCKVKIHVHFGSFSAILGLVVDLSRGVGSPRGGFVIMAGLGPRIACPCEAVCCQAGEGEE